jgi:hypothetical protein
MLEMLQSILSNMISNSIWNYLTKKGRFFKKLEGWWFEETKREDGRRFSIASIRYMSGSFKIEGVCYSATGTIISRWVSLCSTIEENSQTVHYIFESTNESSNTKSVGFGELRYSINPGTRFTHGFYVKKRADTIIQLPHTMESCKDLVMRLTLSKNFTAQDNFGPKLIIEYQKENRARSE